MAAFDQGLKSGKVMDVEVVHSMAAQDSCIITQSQWLYET